MWVLLEQGDAAIVPTPSYPIHMYGPLFAGADLRRVVEDARQLKRVLEAFPTHYPRHILEQAAIAGAFVPGAVDADLQGVADKVAKRLDLIALEVFEQDMVGVKGYDAAILDVLTRHNVRIVSKVSNANTITHYVDSSLKTMRRVEKDLAGGHSSR